MIQDVLPVGLVRVGVYECLDHLSLVHHFYGLRYQGIAALQAGMGGV